MASVVETNEEQGLGIRTYSITASTALQKIGSNLPRLSIVIVNTGTVSVNIGADGSTEANDLHIIPAGGTLTLTKSSAVQLYCYAPSGSPIITALEEAE